MLKANYYCEPTELDIQIFEKLVPTNHYLRQVKAAINFERLREKVKNCYSPNMGRPAEDPVIMIKLEFLQFQYNLSDREIITQAQVNIAFRYFLDLSLDSQLPVPSVLAQFRTRLGVERHQALFDDVVAQARQHGLIKDKLRLKDATHIIANIAVPSTLALIAQVRENLLKSAKPFAPTKVIEHQAKAYQIRINTNDLKDQERLQHRVNHLREIISWADELQNSLASVAKELDGAKQQFDQALAVAHQVLADREKPQEGDKLVSIVDQDARQGKHGDYYDGYMLDIAIDADSELITALDILPANADEAANAENLIRAEESAHGNNIEQLSMDGVAFRGDILHSLSDEAGLGLIVFVPPHSHQKEETYFTSSDFHFDESGKILICPGQAQAIHKVRSYNGTGWQYRFSRTACRQCPLLNRCMSHLPEKNGRSVIKNDYEADYKAARERAKTVRYAEVRKLHPRIERKFANIMRYHNGRRTRYRGSNRVKIQYFVTAMVINIKRMVRQLSLATYYFFINSIKPFSLYWNYFLSSLSRGNAWVRARTPLRRPSSRKVRAMSLSLQAGHTTPVRRWPPSLRAVARRPWC